MHEPWSQPAAHLGVAQSMPPHSPWHSHTPGATHSPPSPAELAYAKAADIVMADPYPIGRDDDNV